MIINKICNYYGIITLTSWKKRINYTHITINSLLTTCPNFKIVLVLSVEEFPNKLFDLPEQLLQLCKYIDILWVYENFKQFKKLLFTLHKYNNYPIITADDGCIYLKNFAKELYDLWLVNQNNIISRLHWYLNGIHFGSGGYGMLFPPDCFKNYGIKVLKENKNLLLSNGNDDAFIGCLAKELQINITFMCELGVRDHNIFKNIDECESIGLGKNNAYSRTTILPLPSIVHNSINKLIKI